MVKWCIVRTGALTCKTVFQKSQQQKNDQRLSCFRGDNNFK